MFQTSCPGLNISACPVSETSSQFLVFVYNPLSHPTSPYIRFVNLFFACLLCRKFIYNNIQKWRQTVMSHFPGGAVDDILTKRPSFRSWFDHPSMSDDRISMAFKAISTDIIALKPNFKTILSRHRLNIFSWRQYRNTVAVQWATDSVIYN